MLNMNQTGCRMGGVAFAAGEDLSLKAGYLVKLNAGKDLVLPESDQDFAQYLIVQGADQGYLCGAVPVTSAMNCRIKLVGSCNAGELLVANGDGRVKAFTAGSLARPVGLAEETGVDGQLVLVRPLAYGLTGPAGADGAAGAAGADGPAGADGRDGGMLVVPYADILHKAVLIGNSTGRCVWLVNVSGTYSWDASWSFAYASQDVMQYVVAGNDGTNVFLLPIGESSAGTFSAKTPQPMAVPLTCVKAGTPAPGGYLGAVTDTGGDFDEVLAFASDYASPGFVGACYLKVLAVNGDYLTCVAGGTLSYGG